jgi:hypothetical protein
MIACTRLADEVLPAFALLVKKRKALMETRAWRHVRRSRYFGLLCCHERLYTDGVKSYITWHVIGNHMKNNDIAVPFRDENSYFHHNVINIG